MAKKSTSALPKPAESEVEAYEFIRQQLRDLGWVVKDPSRGVRLVPRSISFASMSEQQFKRVSDRWLFLISTEVIPGVDPESLLHEAEAA